MKKSILKLFCLFLIGIALFSTKPVFAQQYDNYIWSSPTPAPITAENTAVRDDLVSEVRKIINAGHLAPALFDSGLRTGYGLMMFASPGEIIAVLSMAYPYLPSDLQIQVKAYLDREITTYPPHQYGIFPPTWGGMKLSDQPGARREWFPINPNRTVNIWPPIDPTIEVLYPIWLYSYNTNDWTYAQNNWTRLSTIYNNFKSSGTPDSYLKIAGVIGYARIASQLNHPTEASDAAGLATTGLTNGVNFNQFLQTARSQFKHGSISSGYLYTSPLFLYGNSETGPLGIMAGYFPREIGAYMRDNLLAEVQDYSSQITTDIPLWYLTMTGWAVTGPSLPFSFTDFLHEDSYITPEVGWTNFMLHAYVLGDDVNTLKGYLDFPSRIGDLFHIQKLVATIEAPSAGAPSPTPIPTPTPTPSVGGGDVNNDGQVDTNDLKAVLQNYGQAASGNLDQFNDGKINSLDFAQVAGIIERSSPTPSVSPTASASATPSLSPSPTPAPCIFTDVTWGGTTVTESNNISLNVTTSGGCSGKQVNFETRRNLNLQPDQATTNQPNPNPVNLTAGTGNTFTATSSWTADTWVNNCPLNPLGTCDSEYFFKVNLAGETNTTDSNPRLITVTKATIPPPDPNDWPQLGHDAQKTSASPQTVNGPYRFYWRWTDVPFASRAQPVVVDNRLFIGGLNGTFYALQADYDAQGGSPRILWQKDLKDPSDKYNSPIRSGAGVDTINNTVIVGTQHGIIYGLDTVSGNQRWTVTTGGAILASPVIANGTAYLGSADGSFYSIRTSDGHINWQHTITDPLKGNIPILGSAALSSDNSRVFFAAENVKAYGLNTSNGSVAWFTQLQGQSGADRWPVVLNDTVVFRTQNFRGHSTLLYEGDCVMDGTYPAGCNGTYIPNPLLADWQADWNQIRPSIVNYLTANSNAQTFFALDINSGQIKGPAPVLMTYGDSDPPAPPLVYNNAFYLPFRARHGIQTDSVVGVHVTSRYDAELGRMDPGTLDITNLSNTNTFTYQFRMTSDEPANITMAGDLLLVDSWERLGGIKLTGPTNGNLLAVAQHSANSKCAWGVGGPQIQFMEDCPIAGSTTTEGRSRVGVAVASGRIFWQVFPVLEPENRSGTGNNAGGLTAIGPANGITNPAVPTITPLPTPAPLPGPIATPSAQTLANYVWNEPQAVTNPPADLVAKLEQEVGQVLLADNHLMPFFLARGDGGSRTIPGSWPPDTTNPPEPAEVSESKAFWFDPGEQLYTLSLAYPYLNSTLQGQLKSYIQSEMSRFAPLNNLPYCCTSFDYRTQGQSREPFPVPDNIRRNNTWPPPGASIQTIYALWAYAKYAGDWTYLQNNWTGIKALFDSKKAIVDNYGRIAGAIGYARIARQLGHTAEATEGESVAVAAMQSGLDLNQWYNRANTLYHVNHSHYAYTVAKRDPGFLGQVFFGLTPEIGRYLKDTNLTAVDTYLNRLTNYPHGASLWYATRLGLQNETQEDSYQKPYIGWSVFLAQAYIRGASQEQLRFWLDRPWGLGDMYYLQKLVATIEASSAGAPSPTPSPIPTSTPTPTPGSTLTPVPTATPTPTPLPTPTAIPTPTPAPCTLTSAAWSQASAVVNSQVGLTVNATGSCTGQIVTFEVWQNGILGGQMTDPTPKTATFTAGNQVTSTWITQYTPVIPFTDPEYYIKAILGTQTIQSLSNALLKVTQTPTITNIIQNGNFETGNLNSWSGGGTTATITNSPVHTGSYAFRSTGGSIDQTVSVTAGRTYKATAWVYINNVTGGSWGGPRIKAEDTTWREIGSTNNLQDIMPRSTWTKVSFDFVPNENQSRISVYNYSDRTVDFVVDDIQVFEQPSTNTPPTITALNASPTTVTTIGTPVNFSQAADDPDGTIKNFFWDFGDGGKSNLPNPSYSYIKNGNFQVKLTVIDDRGAIVSQTVPVTINDTSYPAVTVNAPSSEVNQPTVALSGTTSGNGISAVTWSDDRGGTGTATGTTSWSAAIPLQGGKNRILISAKDSSGRVAATEATVFYRPATAVSIGTVTANKSQVEQYDKLELTFPINNSVSSNPNFPYETNPPGLIEARTGITVNGEFSQTGFLTKVVQPGFLYQDYDSSPINQNTEWRYPQGSPVWKVRFAPPSLGNWQYRITVQDDSGTATSSTGSFTATALANPQNHGFIQVSKNDSRYFEFSDGTPYWPLGPVPGVGKMIYPVLDEMAKIGTDSANFGRPWLAGSIYGSAWGPWFTDPLLQPSAGSGSPAGTSLTTEQAYGDGIFSIKLTLPDNRCIFQGPWNDPGRSLKSNARYRLMVRAKLVGINTAANSSYPFGLVARRVGWPTVGDFCTGFVGSSNTPLISHQNGTKDWQVYTADFTNDSRTNMDYLDVILENVNGGAAYIDEVSLKEILADGSLGSEILLHAKANYQNYFDQSNSFVWDKVLDGAATYGMYYRPVISEKQDEIFNKIAPAGMGDSFGGHFDDLSGATLRYQEYYWRYLTARYGYSKNIHSWELANEQDPDNGGPFSHANYLARWMDQNDPNRHMAITSVWAVMSNLWTNPSYQDLDYVDVHAYSDTNWCTGCGNLHDDSAALNRDISMYIYNNRLAGNKPITRGETGVFVGGTYDPLLADDVQGIWYHKLIWAQVNPGAMSDPNHWYFDIIQNNLTARHPTAVYLPDLNKSYVNFMKGIPLNNGHYQDTAATSTNANIRAWGQKDTTNGKAHLWIDNRTTTWINIVRNTGVTSVASGSTVTFSGMPQGNYNVFWYDTFAGTTLQTSTTTVSTNGTVTLTIPYALNATRGDIAVKVENQVLPSLTPTASPVPTGTETPTPTRSPSPTATPSTIPIATPSATLTPTPTPGPVACTLTSGSASWSSISSLENTSVNLTVRGNDPSCSGQIVSFNIKKNELLLDTDITTLTATMSASLTATASWTTPAWFDDCGGIDPRVCDPSYHFDAVVGSSSEKSNDLIVTQVTTPQPVPVGDWPQLQKDAAHSGITSQGVVGPFREKWRFNSVPISGRVQPIVVSGRVYIGSNNGKMYALDANSSGPSPTILWEYQTGGKIVDSAAYSYDTKYLYFGSTDGFVYALDTQNNGREVWKKQTGGSVRTAPVVAYNKVYIGSDDGVMHAYNESNGNEDWSFTTDNNAPILEPAAAANNTVFFGDLGSKAYAIDALNGPNNGQPKWKTQLSGQGMQERWPVVINSTSGTKVVFSTTPAYYFHSLLAQGTGVLYPIWDRPWAEQKQAIINHFQTNPQDRSLHVLDAATGREDTNTPILYTSGNNVGHAPPIGNNDSDTKVVYRFTDGVSRPQGMSPGHITINYWDLYLGQWNLSTQDITPLDNWGADPTTPNWTKKAAIISDETTNLSQGGNNLYLMTWRGLYTQNLLTKNFSGILQEANDQLYYLPYSSAFYILPPSCANEATCQEMGPKAEARQSAYRPAVIANGLIFHLYDSNLVAVEGTVQ